ncbi:MAG: leucyl aminopeptidase family protein, partial [Bacteroidetes bacterium]|nr:leucyl aminopeptidase family protein [Bacteroidota bacterium]
MTQLNLKVLGSDAKSNQVVFLAKLDALQESKLLKDYQKASILADGKEKKFHFRDESGNLFVYIADESEEKCRKQGNQLFSSLSSLKLTEWAIYLEANEERNYAFIEGLKLSSYSFDKYKSSKVDKSYEIYLSGLSEENLAEINTLCKANFTARTLVNEPHSFLNANQYSKEITQLGQEFGFSVKVLNKAAIQEHKMGGVLAVNKGSIQEPTFNILEYKGSNACNNKPIVLVGKGVMYDTGGLSLKPTPGSMDLMKSDMAGSAAVVGAFCAIASQKLPIHVIGLIPATDNRPGLDAVVPGDVITMMSGKSVEVLNTDAEGRLILADALHYAKQYEPEF